jgi:uncharacterized protein (UPF0264 family)
MKKIGLALVMMALLAVTVGAASAQDGSTQPKRQPVPRSDNQPLRDRIRPAVRLNFVDAVVEETGLTVQELVSQLREEGATLANVIEANGSSADAVIANAVASATERINTQIANGRLSQERADELITSLESLYTDIMDNGRLPNLPGQSERTEGVVSSIVRAVLQSAAEQTGLDVSAIREQLRDGATLADILTANGVEVEVFVDGLVAQAETRLNQAVENGRITQEQMDKLLTNLRERLTNRINTPRPSAGDEISV